MALQKVERDFRTMKTGSLEVRSVFVRKESRTCGHVLRCLLALKLTRELERRLSGVFRTTDDEPTPGDCARRRSSLEPPVPVALRVGDHLKTEEFGRFADRSLFWTFRLRRGSPSNGSIQRFS